VEWHRWLDRCREIKIGTDVLMNATRPNAQRLTVAWIGEAHDPLVFVDESGRKMQTLTLQQTAMYLRRGTLKVLTGEAVPAVDRALYGVLQRMHGQLEQEATHDRITGFLNRKNFVAQVERNLPDLTDTKRGAILAQIRLTELATVNLEHGTAAGDALLSGAAAIIRESTGKHEVIYGKLDSADLGLYFRRAAVKGVQKTLEGLLEAFAQRGVSWDGIRLEIVACCGFTEFTDRVETAEQLLSAAAASCDAAQLDPEQPIRVGGQTDTRQRQRLESVVAYVPKAIDRQRLRLLYRTVRPANEAEEARPTLHLVIGAVDRSHKPIPPDLFAQAVANSEFAAQVDRWMISQALQWLSSNPERMERHDSLIVPLSAAALGEDLLTGFIIDELMRTAAPPGKICFAMNDADVLTHLTGAVELARTLHDFGCRFMLDEFGSGQSNYEYVRELKVDYVTIQSLFVRDAARDSKDLAMVKSINELAHFMGKRTIARQVAAPELITLLRDVGVDFIHEMAEPLALGGE
jgi:EAL domain-containing protein (putative c-di-GMP-specific phosphodiesterase class I)/GGDEF domain-containing protein